MLTQEKKKLKEESIKKKLNEKFKDLDLKLDDNKTLYISDDLSKAKSALAAEARKKRREGKIKETWVSYGKIFMKKHDDSVHVVNSFVDLL